MKKKNPILQKKYDEGYKDGFEQGVFFGKEMVKEIGKRVESIKEIKGIGEKTYMKIRNVIENGLEVNK